MYRLRTDTPWHAIIAQFSSKYSRTSVIIISDTELSCGVKLAQTDIILLNQTVSSPRPITDNYWSLALNSYPGFSTM